MPTLSRWLVRTALIALLAGLGLGLAASASGRPALLMPTVIHLLVVGWLTQMIFGVGLWLFPKSSVERPRGHLWLGWICYGSLNAGLLLRVVAEPPAAAGHALPGLLPASAILQLVAALAFVANAWPRLRAR